MLAIPMILTILEDGGDTDDTDDKDAGDTDTDDTDDAHGTDNKEILTALGPGPVCTASTITLVVRLHWLRKLPGLPVY